MLNKCGLIFFFKIRIKTLSNHIIRSIKYIKLIKYYYNILFLSNAIRDQNLFFNYLYL